METVRGLERGLLVLRTLRSTNALSLAELHRATALAKPTLLRLLTTLEAEGMVSRSLGDGLYRYRSIDSALVPRKHQRLAEAAGPVLAALHQRVLWPSDVVVRRGRFMEIVETNRGLSRLRLARDHLGDKIDVASTAVGRAYLAYCPEAERRRLVDDLASHPDARGAMGPVDRHALAEALEQTRARGYAVRDPRDAALQRMGRGDDLLDAIAVPIRTSREVLGCINLLWPRRFELMAEIVRLHLADLVEASGAIAAATRQRAAS